ncbi:CAP domain-containing protein [Flavihumibacter sp. UBA7668]|uniref:CAP domain-containing protein n=1 Tax=Flavihumibacter sp. UBA7668 TaxID=1946542 RepID=UPI0025C3A781|nr:CAP domain-containing protein [Flavihumibacter sp. UBA7668]
MKKVLFVACIFLFVACQKESKEPKSGEEESTPATPTNPPTGSTVVYNVNKATMLQLINDIRTKGCTCGSTVMPPVPKLEWNDKLAKAAYLHSFDMNSKNYFSHTSQDGRCPGDRITAQGFNWSSYGENIARGQANEAAVMNGWLNSEGHCKNIMNSRFKYVGVGMQNKYWTQVFGSLR